MEAEEMIIIIVINLFMMIMAIVVGCIAVLSVSNDTDKVDPSMDHPG